MLHIQVRHAVWLRTLGIKANDVRAFAERLRDFRRAQCPRFADDEQVAVLRCILRKSPWVRAHDEDLLEIASADVPADAMQAGDIETAHGINTRAIKRAGLAGRLAVFVPRPSASAPRFSLADVLDAHPRCPSRTQVECLAVAADEMLAQGLWLGEPLALWLSAASIGNGSRSRDRRADAWAMLCERAPWMPAFNTLGIR